MTWVVVRGQYRRGGIQLLEHVSTQEGTQVLVLLPEVRVPDRPGRLWARIKEEIAREIPELATMTLESRRDQFERLSSAIAEHMPYRSVEEFERAMRGDDYGLAGY